MKKLPAVPLLAIVLLTASVPATTACSTTGPDSQCCRVCETGKACGDSCISRDEVCHQPDGCACNG